MITRRASQTNNPARIYDAITRYYGQHQRVPAYREISAMVDDISTSVIKYNLLILQERGLLAGVGEGKARGYRLVTSATITLPMPAGLTPEQRRAIEGRLRLALAEAREELGV